MIGGKVDRVWRLPDRHIITVYDPVTPRTYDTLCIDVVPNDHPISRGDSIWWQARIALWTPRDKHVEDVHIQRIGYSYTPPAQWPEDVMQMLCDGICPDCNHPECMADGIGSLWCPRCDASYASPERQNP